MGKLKKLPSGRRRPLTIYEQFFEIEVILSERFPALDPFRIRTIRAREIFLFMPRLGGYIERDKEENGEVVEMNGRKVIRRKAGDSWF